MKSRYLIAAAAIGSLSNNLWAAGFAISGKSASNLGNAFSGTTVLAEDASVVYTNPAAMQDLEGRHFSFLVHSINSNLHFKDKGSNTTGPSNNSVTDPHYVPNLYYVMPLEENMRFGLGIYAPFGLGLDYNDNWKGRYITTGSDMKIVNVSPMLSFQLSDSISLGLGLDAQYLDATLENKVDFGKALGQPQKMDGTQKLTGTDWAYGYSLGMTYDLNEQTRLGASYHSPILHNIDGHSDFGDVPSLLQSTYTDTGASLSLTLPQSLSLGLSHKVSPRLQLMADATWTGWSSYDKLVIKFDNNVSTSRTKENWNDTWRLSLGGNYRINDKWLMRAGISHDPTPIPDAQHRSPRVPGTTRDWLSLGSKVELSKGMSMDLAASYTLPVSYKINNTDAYGHTLKGEYESEFLYLTAQLNWQF